MMRPFTGIQTGPRQFELPPNIPVFDSAGRYETSYVRPWIWKTNGWSLWWREQRPNAVRTEEFVLVEEV